MGKEVKNMEKLRNVFTRKISNVRQGIEANISKRREREKIEALDNLVRFSDFPHEGECLKATGIRISVDVSLANSSMAPGISFKYATCLDCRVISATVFNSRKK